MVQDKRHRALAQFIAKTMDVIVGYSKDDLIEFRSASTREYPALVPLLDEYIHLSERTDTNVAPIPGPKTRRYPEQRNASQVHLFDLLRDKKLFPSNSDLAAFAGQILPDIKGHRFDKMSRADIAGRMVEHIESKDKATRMSLEESMRQALDSPTVKPSDRKSFMSKWEAIIKGIQL